jgi:hypothetical protein
MDTAEARFGIRETQKPGWSSAVPEDWLEPMSDVTIFGVHALIFCEMGGDIHA